MKRKSAITLILVLFASLSFAQSHIGTWSGSLSINPNTKMKLLFHLKPSGNKSTMDSPDQGAKGIVINSVDVVGDKFSLSIASLGVSYSGTIKGDKIEGTFKQSGMSFPLVLVRGEGAKPNRPQEPKPPFNYKCEEVVFDSKSENVKLAGTLTMPSSGVASHVVVMITGSGAQDRNEEIMGHKPFWVIADYLTKNGIAVLRYDDRGVGGSKGGVNKNVTSVDFAQDTEGAVSYLRGRNEFKNTPLGLIGHSEGGMIAFMIGAKSKDVDFIVSLAGTGIRGDSVLMIQNYMIAKDMGLDESVLKSSAKVNRMMFDLVIKEGDNSNLDAMLHDLVKKNFPDLSDEMIEKNVKPIVIPWFRFFLSYDPTENLKKIKIPVLALNGDKDLQVTSKENLSAIERSIKSNGNKRVKCIELAGMNHLFQTCTAGSVSEYRLIEETFSPSALEIIKKWILEIK